MRQAINFGTIGPRNWNTKPVAIIGGGPSLKDFDFTRLKDRFTVLAVNASMFDVPFAGSLVRLGNLVLVSVHKIVRDVDDDIHFTKGSFHVVHGLGLPQSVLCFT